MGYFLLFHILPHTFCDFITYSVLCSQIPLCGYEKSIHVEDIRCFIMEWKILQKVVV